VLITYIVHVLSFGDGKKLSLLNNPYENRQEEAKWRKKRNTKTDVLKLRFLHLIMLGYIMKFIYKLS